MNSRFFPRPRNCFHAIIYIPFLAILILSTHCVSKNGAYVSPPGYDLNKPLYYKLPTILDEISGLYFYKKDSGIFAIQDEKGWLFKIKLGTQLQIERWKFATGADFEDIVMVDSTFYVLRSKGSIEKFTFSSPDSVSLQSYKLSESGKNEFETLYVDSAKRQLVMICKNCEQDNRKVVSAWAFDLSTETFSPDYAIETAKIREDLGEDDKFKFKPSAAAIHPITGELYVISSVNRALVILNKDHTVKNSYKLNPAIFKQPEGLTFTPKGDLLISNEAAETGAANLLFYKYNNSKRK